MDEFTHYDRYSNYAINVDLIECISVVFSGVETLHERLDLHTLSITVRWRVNSFEVLPFVIIAENTIRCAIRLGIGYNDSTYTLRSKLGL